MKDELTHVLDSTVQLFLRYGIRSVSMDDVAKEVGMSKKTIYQHFTDRSNLVDAVIMHFLGQFDNKCREIGSNQRNPVDELLEIGKFFHSTTRQMNPTLLFDLKKYFPSTWKKMMNYRNQNVLKQVTSNIERGIDLGLYRNDLNIEIIARLYMNLIDIIIDDDLFPKINYTFKELHHEMLQYHLHGISSLQGIEYLNEKKSNHE